MIYKTSESLNLETKDCYLIRHSALDAESMVRQAHHDTIVTLSLSKGWIPAFAGMTLRKLLSKTQEITS